MKNKKEENEDTSDKTAWVGSATSCCAMVFSAIALFTVPAEICFFTDKIIDNDDKNADALLSEDQKIEDMISDASAKLDAVALAQADMSAKLSDQGVSLDSLLQSAGALKDAIEQAAAGIKSEIVASASDTSDQITAIEEALDKHLDEFDSSLKDYKDSILSLATTLFAKLSEAEKAGEDAKNELASQIQALQKSTSADAAQLSVTLSSVSAQTASVSSSIAALQASADQLAEALKAAYKINLDKSSPVTSGSPVTVVYNKAWDCDHQDGGYFFADSNKNEKWDKGDYHYNSYETWNGDDTLPRQTPFFGYYLNQMLTAYPSGDVVFVGGQDARHRHGGWQRAALWDGICQIHLHSNHRGWPQRLYQIQRQRCHHLVRDVAERRNVHHSGLRVQGRGGSANLQRQRGDGKSNGGEIDNL
jgi:predicted  nucleic acid-binding Zn-ribbon protein